MTRSTDLYGYAGGGASPASVTNELASGGGGTTTTTHATTTTTSCSSSITAVGSLAEKFGANLVSFSPANVGDIDVLAVQAQPESSAVVASVSGGGVPSQGWSKAIAYPGSATSADIEIWWGKVTSTGSSPISVTWSGSTPTYRELDAQEFSASSGPTWSVDKTGDASNSTETSYNMASLTPRAAVSSTSAWPWWVVRPPPGPARGSPTPSTTTPTLVAYDTNVSSTVDPAGSQSGGTGVDSAAVPITASGGSCGISTTTTAGTTTTTFGGGSGTATTYMVNLTGGVLLEVTGSTETWYYPNLEGGTAAEASSTGAAVGGITLYDPFGNALRSLQADSPDGLAYGFEGKHGIVTDTDAGGVVLMGARLYNPGTGRFLQVDPVFGGSCNAYDYTCQDPVNQNDLSGRSGGQPAISGAITQCTQHGGRWNSGFGRGVYPGTRQGTDNAEAWVALGVTLGVIAAATGIGAAIEGSILLAVVSLAATAGSLYLDGKSCFHGGDNLACAGLVLDFSAGLASDGAFAAGLVGAKLLGTALGYFGVNVGLGGLSVDAVGWVFGK